MYLGLVTGRVVCSIKAPGLAGVKLLVVQPIDEEGGPVGKPIVAADAVQACVGERVFLVGGREASMALPERFVPVDATIVGHVEQLAVDDKGTS